MYNLQIQNFKSCRNEGNFITSYHVTRKSSEVGLGWWGGGGPRMAINPNPFASFPQDLSALGL